MWRVLVLVAAMLGVAEAGPKRRVVIVSVDGLRHDAITKQVMPRHAKLAAEGATASVARTIAKSHTLPAHASMLSGVDVDVHKMTWNSYQAKRGHISVPTVFTAAHAKGLATAMFVGKRKLQHLATPGAIDHYELPDDPSCTGVAAAAAHHFDRELPDLMFVHFADPDDAGHQHGWGSREYKRALETSDRCLGVLVDAIDKAAGASTLIILTADHGGDGHSHADGDAQGTRRIPWIARGPGAAKGSTITEPVATFDTAATTLAMLGLAALPKMLGKPRITP